jgi:hypothetical protein
VYLEALEQCGGFEVVEDGFDDKCDIFLVFPFDREDLHQRLIRLRRGACVNRFPGMQDACEKVSFCRAIRQRLPFCPSLADFVPPTWLLPEEYGIILHKMDEAAQAGQQQAFIVKPEYGLQGDGIFIVRNRVDLQVACATRGLSDAGPSYVCQQYVSSPLTLDGFKFDLRIYVVLTSLAPLEAWLCREGIARFCTTPYAVPTAANISCRTAHLTNYSLNSKEDGFARTQAGASPESASKRLLSAVLEQVHQTSNGKFCKDRFWTQVEEISSLMLVALLPSLAFAAKQYFPVNEAEPSRCYHVLGLDVLLDSDYWPWILEVNSCPAMDIETAVPVEEAAPAKSNPRMTRVASQPELRKNGKGASSSSSTQRSTRNNPSRSRSSSSVASQPSHPPRLASVGASSEPTLPCVGESGRATPPEQAPPLLPACSSSDVPTEVVHRSGDEAHPPEGVKKRKRKKQASQKKKTTELVEEPPPKYTDAWNGYQPSKMRHRAPWPEICYCVSLRKPHRHAVCEVDKYAKTVAIEGTLRIITGREVDSQFFIKVPFPLGLVRVTRALWDFVDLCGRLAVMRSGVSGGSLRKVLQASDEVTLRPDGHGKGRMCPHEIDFVTSENGRHRFVQREHPCSAKIALFPLFDMLLEVSRRCCDKDPALADAAPIAKFEWLMQAIRAPPEGAAPLVPSYIAAAKKAQDSNPACNGRGSLVHSAAAKKFLKGCN